MKKKNVTPKEQKTGFRIKKGFIAFGVCMAILGTFFASALPWRYSRRAEALVLVKDPNNIAEAIKMVNHTFNILTAEQEKIALMLLQLKKLDTNTLSVLWEILKTDQVFNENLKNAEAGKWGNVIYRLDGILSGSASIPATWQDGLGEVADILNGQAKPGGCFGNGATGMVVLGKVLKDSATISKVGQVSDTQLLKMALQAYEAGQKAEGQVQAIQAGNAIAAANVSATTNVNRTLGYFATSYAVQQQRELTKEAYEIKSRMDAANYMDAVRASLPTTDFNY